MAIQKDDTRSLAIFSLGLVLNAPEKPMRYMALDVGFYVPKPKLVQVLQQGAAKWGGEFETLRYSATLIQRRQQ